MSKKVAVFWPGDGRKKPNELALPNVEAASVQLEKALKKLGREPYRIPGFLSKPHEARDALGPIDDPVAGVFASFMIASLARTVSIVPAGLGIFEGVGVLTLHQLGVPIAAALSATLLFRGLSYWLPMIPGFIASRKL